MGMGNTVKAIWTLLQGTTNPDVVALYNYLYQNLEGAKMNAKQPMGRVYYVNGNSLPQCTPVGSDANDGLTPATPFETIQHAVDLCTVFPWDKNDYIFCYNLYNQDAYPINVTADGLHIIGWGGPIGQPCLLAANADNAACFNFPVGLGENCEIAGFNMGAGAAHGCIELQGNNANVWIHNNIFGHLWAGGGQDGVWLGTTIQGGVIEDNWFHGTDCGSGVLTRCAVYVSSDWVQGTLRNNYAFKMPGVGANGSGGLIYGNNMDGVAIIHNKVNVGDGETAHGGAIFLLAGCDACVIAQNEANDGLAVSTKNPYVDEGGANDNAWISNQWGITINYPETAA